MKTLVLFGSPLKDSHTRKLLDIALNEIEGEAKLIDAYNSKIAPCIDCKFCFHKKGCSIKDDMTAIYDYISECDNVIIASPMHFGVVSAPLMTIFSRLQPYWSNEFVRRSEEDIPKQKKGLLLMTTGADWMNIELLAEGVANTAFHHLNAHSVGSVYAKKTDDKPILENKAVIHRAQFLARELNKQAN